ncbi:MAG: 2-hydroxyacyl-CoA dehydratase family protein [Candidatus Doudnabacteria bacterium]|nr:2-hydroxyacyl-CoA dehydratase family protein [Candidatus Doudnabacteria bacterium]
MSVRTVTARELLGDLTDRKQYSDQLLAELFATVRDKLNTCFTLRIGSIGLAAVGITEQARLQFVQGATNAVARGNVLADYIGGEQERRKKVVAEFQQLLEQLYGHKPGEEAVKEAVARYEEHQRNLNNNEPLRAEPTAPRHVPPRVTLRTESKKTMGNSPQMSSAR